MKDVNKMTVEEVVLKDIEIGHYSPVTIRMIKYISKSEAFKLIDRLSLEELTVEKLREWIDWQIEQGYSTHTINNNFGILNRAQRRFTEKNLKCARPSRSPIKTSFKKTVTENELTDMLLYADIETSKTILLSYYACMNVNEISALTYKDIFFDNNAICLHSEIVLENGVWKHKQDSMYEQTMRFALIPKEVMEYIGKGAPKDHIINSDENYIGSKVKKVAKKAGIDMSTRELKTAILYKKVLVNPIGIFENQAAFCFAENNTKIIDCLNDFIEKHNKCRRYYNVRSAFFMLENLSLKDLSRKVLEAWLKDIAEKYELWGVKRNYWLLRETLFECSNGKFRLEKFGLTLYSNKTRNVSAAKKVIDIEEARRLMDKADSELKKAMLLSGYGGFSLKEIQNIKIKDIDKEQNVIRYAGVEAAFSKAAIRFLGRGENDDLIVKKSSFVLTHDLAILRDNYGNVDVSFHNLRGAFIAPPPSTLKV